MVKFYFILLIIFTSVAIPATEVTLIMTDFIYKSYLKTPTGHSVYYKIKGQKHTQVFRKNNIVYWSELKSQQKNFYEKGELIFPSCNLHFDFAYYYKGKLILQNAHGVIGGKNVQSRNIKFSSKKRELSSKRIIFTGINKSKIKINYTFHIPPEDFI